MKTATLNFSEIAADAGFKPGPDGRLNLPPTQETADALSVSAQALLGSWEPGSEPVDVTLTGAGPVWGHLAIAHGLHGRASRLTYAAPNAPAIVIFNHGL